MRTCFQNHFKLKLEEKKVVESSTIAFSRGSLFSCPIDSVLTNAFIPRYEGRYETCYEFN